MSDEDWEYIKELENNSRDENLTVQKSLTWKQVAEGTVDVFKNAPNEASNLIKQLRKTLMEQDKTL